MSSLPELSAELDARIKSTARSIAGRRAELAEDLAQEGRIAALEARSEWEPCNKVPMSAWCYISACWRMRDVARFERRRDAAPIVAPLEAGLDPFAQLAAREALEAIQALPDHLLTVALAQLDDEPSRLTARRLRVTDRHVRRYRAEVARLLRSGV